MTDNDQLIRATKRLIVTNKQTEHDRATEAWALTNRHHWTNPMGPLSARKQSQPQTPDDRRRAVKRNLERLHEINQTARRIAKRAPDQCRYFPHQGAREMARRVGQMAKGV